MDRKTVIGPFTTGVSVQIKRLLGSETAGGRIDPREASEFDLQLLDFVFLELRLRPRSTNSRSRFAVTNASFPILESPASLKSPVFPRLQQTQGISRIRIYARVAITEPVFVRDVGAKSCTKVSELTFSRQ